MPTLSTIAFAAFQLTIIRLWYVGRFPDASVYEVFFPTVLWVGLGIRSALVHISNSLNTLIVFIFSTVQQLANEKGNQNGV